MQSTCFASLCAALFLLCPSLSAQPVTFQKLYGGSGDQAGNYVVEAQDGGYLIAGSTTDPNLPSDGYLLRVNTMGDILWQKRMGGSSKDGFQVAKQTDDGGFIILGETASTGSGENDIWLVKITAAGDVVWERVFGGFNSDLGRGLLVIPDGYIISGPQSSTGPSNQSTYVIRLDAAGQTIWSKTYFSGISNILQVEYAEGNTLFACGGLDAHGAFVRLDAATGDVLSTLGFGGSGPEALYYSRPTLDGNLVLANHTWSVTGGVEFRYWVRKVTKNGAPIWSKTYGIPGLNMRGKIETLADGGFLLNPRQDNAAATNNDAYLIKLNALGAIVWAYNYGGASSTELLSSAQETVDGGIIAVGQQQSGNGNVEILLLKTDGQGLIEGCCIPPANFETVDFNPSNVPVLLEKAIFFAGQAAGSSSVGTAYTGTDYCPPNNQFVNLYAVISLCPGQLQVIGGQTYTAPSEVTDTLFATNGNCDTIVAYQLLSKDPPQTESELLLCPGKFVVINGMQYGQAGVVVDTISHPGGCDTVRVTTIRLDDENSFFLPADTVLCPGDGLTLTSPFLQTSWNGGYTGPTFEVHTPGMVLASALNENGCLRRDTIRIGTCCSEKSIYLPNVFSPNDDGENDGFCVYTIERCANYQLRVYDRWGALLFESKAFGECWDGTFRGKPVAAGVYVWTIQFYADAVREERVLSGDVTLLR